MSTDLKVNSRTREQLTCLICQDKNLVKKQYYNSHFYNLKNDIFDDLCIFVCSVCGFGYSHPFIDVKKIEYFYTHEYNQEGGPHYEFKDFKQYNWSKYFSSRFVSQFLIAAQFIELDKVKNFLDIGANNGESFSTLNKMGHSPNPYAVEINEDYVADINDKNLNLILSKDENLCLDKKYHNFFDLILMSHVLEHFNANQLDNVLININKILSKDGVLVVEVPNDDFRKFYNSENVSPHLTFFSIESLIRLFKKNDFDIMFINSAGKKKSKKESVNQILFQTSKLKVFLKKYFIFRYINNFIINFVLKWLKLKIKYKTTNHGKVLVSSNNFQYGPDRSVIRVCLKRAK